MCHEQAFWQPVPVKQTVKQDWNHWLGNLAFFKLMLCKAVNGYSRVRVPASLRQTRESKSTSRDPQRTRHSPIGLVLKLRPCSLGLANPRVLESPFKGVPGSQIVGLLPALVLCVLWAAHAWKSHHSWNHVHAQLGRRWYRLRHESSLKTESNKASVDPLMMANS